MTTENRFNLIDEPWIPIADAGRVSLGHIFSEQGANLRALGGDPLQKIALFKLLQAIAQAAGTPHDDQAWQTLGAAGLCRQVRAYLQRWHDRFWLYGERPFLQMPAIARAKIVPYGALLPEVATGNTTLLTQIQQQKPLDDAARALLLVVLMSQAFGGKKTDNSVVLTPGYRGKVNEKGKPATGQPGPALMSGLLHNFFEGETLQETLWFNLFTQADLSQLEQYAQPADQRLGIPPWEQMPQGEDCAVAQRLKQTLMGRLLPLGRFCLLTAQGVHYSEGIQHGSHRDGRYDPSVLVNAQKATLQVKTVDPARRPWRDLTALLAFLHQDSAQTAWQCDQLRLSWPHIRDAERPLALWSGGLKVSNKAGEQYVAGSDDFVESRIALPFDELGTNWFALFSEEMLYLEKLAKQLYGCVYRYYHKHFSVAPTEAKKIAQKATERFWQYCEQDAQRLVDNCSDSEARDKLRQTFRRYRDEIFGQLCPHVTARQLSAWAECHPRAVAAPSGKEAA